MSPPPPPTSGKQRESGAARLLGSGTSGILELLIFHPVDTVAKRLMSNQTKLFGAGGSGMSGLNRVIFRDAAAMPLGQRYFSLFPGLGFAAGYKISQRIYKFGGQPYVTDYLSKHHSEQFKQMFGDRNGKTMIHATAGSIIGVGEVLLLPLDVLKIKRQTNPEAFRGRSAFRIFADEGFALYRGGMWTAARNAPGSFSLFGGSAFVKEYVFGLEDFSKATFFQNFCASIGGAVASITVSAPLDVVKTRIQNRNFDSPESGMKIVRDMIRKEGMGAFFKGLVPKVLVVGPKLIFSFTIAQALIPMFGKYV